MVLGWVAGGSATAGAGAAGAAGAGGDGAGGGAGGDGGGGGGAEVGAVAVVVVDGAVVVVDGVGAGESSAGSLRVASRTIEITSATAAPATKVSSNLVRPDRYHGAGGALKCQVLVSKGSKVSGAGSGSGMANGPVTGDRNGPGPTVANRSVSGSLSDTFQMVGGAVPEPVIAVRVEARVRLSEFDGLRRP
ncbi:hypothetical protein ABIA30_003695 [Mycobacterium sp. MAA66]